MRRTRPDSRAWFDGRRRDAGDGAKASADRNHPRPGPGRHRRLRSARPAEARSGHKAHAGPRDLGRRSAASGDGHGRVRSYRKPAERTDLIALFTLASRWAAKQKPRRRRKLSTAELLVRPMPELARAKVLIVDDDIRNIYSLTSVLETYDVQVLHAERGRTASPSWSRHPASMSR